jgi:translation initiation factor IF-2
MGKIPVQELARLMGVANQDLVFKLKSIGVRVEGEDAHIDTEIVSAILQGKKLPQPREVILRDESAAPEAARRGTAPAPTGRRPVAPNPLRPARPRAVIQRVEPRIKTLPASDRSAPIGPPIPADELPETPLPITLPPRPQIAASGPAAASAPPRSVVLPSRRPGAPGAPSGPYGAGRPALGRPAPGRPGGPASRPGAPTARPAAKTAQEREREEREKERERKAKKGVKKPAGAAAEGEDLRAYMGSVQEIEKAQAELIQDPTASARRRRRSERKEGEESGKVLTFHKQAPAGPVMISEGMTLRDFSEKLGVRARDLIKLLFDRGIVANINHILEPELAQKLAEEFGVEAMVVTFEQEVQFRQEADPRKSVAGRVGRAPVVTIMGHVDHGKTSLLDAIRSANVAASESGGITQHIGAYHVDVGNRKIVFLDTPGHEAFTMMRARGARVTDIVVLVVAADDGVMPQTVEAIDHARAAGVPIVVAINKIDKANANPDRVKKELGDRDLMVEEWGGQTVAVPVSAIKKQGIPELLEMILLTADILDLKGDPEVPAQGTVLEARKEVGRGVVATVLVQNGTLRVGDVFVAGATWGRVRAMADENLARIESAGPATPVEVSGFGDVPAAGDVFQVVEEESKARSIVDFRRQEQRKRELAPTQAALSLEQIFSQIERGEIKELPVVLKADVQGSVEVLRDTLAKLSTERVKVNVIHSAVGAISTNDVLLAAASKALIVGFNVRPEKNAAELAEKEGVELRLHTVIYELSDELRKAMVGLLAPTFKEVTRGRAEVREIFKVPKAGVIAGSHVVEGVVPRGANARLVRDGRVVYEGKIGSLRRFKDDVSEVRAGFDCGIGLDRFQDAKPGDVIEAFVREEVAPVL